jgi:hypothetical protein
MYVCTMYLIERRTKSHGQGQGRKPTRAKKLSNFLPRGRMPTIMVGRMLNKIYGRMPMPTIMFLWTAVVAIE